MAQSLEGHRIVSENEWIECRKILLKDEKEFTILRDRLSQAATRSAMGSR